MSLRSSLRALAKVSKPHQLISSKIPWLDHWNILSTRSYNAVIQERNLQIIGEDNKYILAKDACLHYVGPSRHSKLAINASQVAISRLSAVANKNNLLQSNSDWANGLLHNIVLRSYREFMPSANIALRTCDLSVGDVFVDIGCFRGYLSLKASRIVGPNGLVYSVDPIEDSIDILEKQIEINNLKNIFSFARACVPQDFNGQSVSFLDAGDGSTNNSVLSDHLSVQTRSREVACISVNAILNQIPKAHLSGRRIVASITTNGSEFQLLEEILRQSPVSVTCCIPTLYTYDLVQKQLVRLRSDFPNVLINNSYPWLQVRVEK